MGRLFGDEPYFGDPALPQRRISAGPGAGAPQGPFATRLEIAGKHFMAAGAAGLGLEQREYHLGQAGLLAAAATVRGVRRAGRDAASGVATLASDLETAARAGAETLLTDSRLTDGEKTLAALRVQRGRPAHDPRAAPVAWAEAPLEDAVPWRWRAGSFEPARLSALRRAAPAEADAIEQRIANQALIERTDPGAELGALYAMQQKITGVDPAFLADLVGRESAGRADARNPMSSAVGLGQFIESTWLRLWRTHAFELGLDPDLTPGEILAQRADRRLNVLMTAFYAKENRAAFKSRFKREPDHGEAYVMHFMGAGEGMDFLRDAPRAPDATAIVKRSTVDANWSIFHDKAGRRYSGQQVLNKLTGKFADRPVYGPEQ